ncbi:MAG: NUDIX hydrolase [Anaerolineaceae bacterium]|nr:NUDIX hydrolase [Anaerolineaceae bacterium]
MNEYNILKRDTQYKGKIFDVEKVLLRLPDEREVTYDLVLHQNAVTILPIDTERKIWFVRQYRLGIQREILELPAGVFNDGEDPLTCAGRELQEEIGMSAKILRPIGEAVMSPGYATEYMYYFLASELSSNPLPQDDDEFIEVVKIPLEKVYEMVYSGKIIDNKSLAALLYAIPFLGPLQ